jgi:hypothetical protein
MKPNKIQKIQKEEGMWVEVVFPVGDGWRPSFNELGEILKLIAECEDERYPNGKGADMVIEWSKDAIIGIPYDYLKKKYQLPK